MEIKSKILGLKKKSHWQGFVYNFKQGEQSNQAFWTDDFSRTLHHLLKCTIILKYVVYDKST
jgi:hypothetical protein